MSCNNFLNFLKRYDVSDQANIIREALIPDVKDARARRINGHRTALQSAMDNFTQEDFACQIINLPHHKYRNENYSSPEKK